MNEAQRHYEAQEKKLVTFSDMKEAIEHARKHYDCSTADKACFIMSSPAKKFVVAPLDLCSYLHRKGYKEVIGTFDLADVLAGKEKFTDDISEV